jgi:hypothetical protein
MQYGLQFVAGLDFTEERLQFRVFVEIKIDSVEGQLPLADKSNAVKIAHILVSGGVA